MYEYGIIVVTNIGSPKPKRCVEIPSSVGSRSRCGKGDYDCGYAWSSPARARGRRYRRWRYGIIVSAHPFAGLCCLCSIAGRLAVNVELCGRSIAAGHDPACTGGTSMVSVAGSELLVPIGSRIIVGAAPKGDCRGNWALQGRKVCTSVPSRPGREVDSNGIAADGVS